ncbi:hypothetical protein SLS62_004786 [Diatrype stigma]|uniref:Uncharacterized protein n=1 Tax=Diatrype stigma TaxID=117547 RepID=A0AAN9UU35_9PEZI
MANRPHHRTIFGIHIETTINGIPSLPNGVPDLPDAHEEERWRSIAKLLHDHLVDGHIPNHITLVEDTKDERYQEWCITQNKTIPTQDDPSRLAVELMSPTIAYDAAHTPGWGWASIVRFLYSILDKEPFAARPTSTCALQVSVALDTFLDTEIARNIAEAILIYKPQFEALAAGVGESVVANTLRIGDNENPSPEEIRQYLGSLDTMEQIAEALCPREGGRNYFWDLWPLAGLDAQEQSSGSRVVSVKRRGTVVFRVPYGLEEGESLPFMWIDFANLFVLAATEPVPYYDVPKQLCCFIECASGPFRIPPSELARLLQRLEPLG